MISATVHSQRTTLADNKQTVGDFAYITTTLRFHSSSGQKQVYLLKPMNRRSTLPLAKTTSTYRDERRYHSAKPPTG